MDIRLVLFGMLSTILMYPKYTVTVECSCSDDLSPPSTLNCPIITWVGNICYSYSTSKGWCVILSCPEGVVGSASCKGNGIHSTWDPQLPSSCNDDTSSSKHIQSESIDSTTDNEVPSTSSASTPTINDIITAPISNTSPKATSEIAPTTSTSHSISIIDTSSSKHIQSESIDSTTDNEVPSTSSASTPTINENTQTTDPQDNLTSTEQPTSAKEKHENIAVIVTVPIGIVVVIIIVIIVFILWRRKTRRKGAAIIKPRLHGAISNNSYQDHTSNGNIISMNNLAPATTDNGYVDIFDDKPTPIDTSDSSYNTISLPNETGNTYDHLKPVTQPFVDNTYSHMNKAQIQMGALYSHMGTASEQTKQPVSIDDNTYSHIGKGTSNAKMKQQTVDSGDTYSHIRKEAAVPIIKQQTVETDDTYSHIGKGFNPHHKTADADSGDTYNTLGIMPNVSLQNNDETNDDPEYNHLTSGLQSTSKSSDSQKKDDAFSCYRQEPSSGVTGSSTSDQYAQVGKKDTYEIIDNIEVNTDNEKTSNCFFVVDEDNEESTTQCDTDGGQVNHQYFILEKHERQL